jgi:superfamily II DNA or RNA helicase
MYQPGEWAWSLEHRQACRIVEGQGLWGEVLYRVWVPSDDAVVRVRADQLRSTRDSTPGTAAWVSYLAAAGRIADARSQDVLLAPVEASVIPLPHQVRVLSRAVSGDRIRYLLADEVGLGKTIEAGLIMRELKLRGLVRRTLVVAPRGLVTQWIAEMRMHFGEEFRLLAPADISAFRRLGSEKNLWQLHDQVVVPMDSVKPVDARRGWSSLQVAEHNRERFEDLIAAGWDLVIVDECHRLGGSTDQVARFRLGEGLAEASPYLLLLSATPHQGKTDAFHRIMWLLDSTAFPDPTTVSRDHVQPYVIRTEKSRAITADGEPLFKPRRTQLVPIAWTAAHAQQRALYDAVTEYAREGYNQALQERRTYIGFLMLLMQRLVTSSTRAIRTTLARRLEVLQAPEDQLELFPDLSEEEWLELDGQEQTEALMQSRLKGLRSERAEVESLLRLAESCDRTQSDAKAEALLDWMYRLQQEERDPALKVLVFTEFVPTQEMLRDFLIARGFSVVCLNGSMDMEERQRAQETFAGEARILISTDAGGEGVNLQFCHVVVNFDIPWNPMRLEQRIGRVDRIGQVHVVRAINFILQDTVEYRVREVLEEKLAIILEEFGMDKTGDVLDSAEAGALFDELYAAAITHPDQIATEVDALIQQVRERAQAVREGASRLPQEPPLDPRQSQDLIAHPLAAWVERMTTAYLRAHGGQVRQDGPLYDLTWPDDTVWHRVAFYRRDANLPGVRLVTLEEPRIRELTTRLPRFVPGQPIPHLRLADISPGISGWFALFRVTGRAADWTEHRILPLFVHDDGRVLSPTARRIWDCLLEDGQEYLSPVAGKAGEDAFPGATRAAEEHGRVVYDALIHEHRDRLERERIKGHAAFEARRRSINRIGLPAVRAHRLAQLEAEERAWRAAIDERTVILPELTPILILRVEGQAA